MKNTKLLTIISLSAILGMGALYADCNKSNCGIQKCATTNCNSIKSGDKKCNSFKTNRHNYRNNIGSRDSMKMFSNLNLSDAQKKSLRDLRVSERDKHRDSIMKAHGDIMSQSVTSNGFDKAKFIQLSLENHKAQISKKAEHMEKVFGILTPAQIKTLDKKLNEKK